MGLIIATRSLMIDGPPLDRPPLDRLHWREGVPLLGAILAFGLAIRPLGLVIAAALLFGISSFASADTHWRELLIVSVVLILFSIGLFVLARHLLRFQPAPSRRTQSFVMLSRTGGSGRVIGSRSGGGLHPAPSSSTSRSRARAVISPDRGRSVPSGDTRRRTRSTSPMLSGA
jgi:hypothetical protein